MLTYRCLSDGNASDPCPIEKIIPNVMVLLLCRKVAFVCNLQTYFSMSLLTDYINLCSSSSLWTSFAILLVSSLMSWIIFHTCSLYIYTTVMFLTFFKLLYCDTDDIGKTQVWSAMFRHLKKKKKPYYFTITWSLSFLWFVLSSWFRIC